MHDKPLPRTWQSICQDCVHFQNARCEAGERSSGPGDYYAAICRKYTGKSGSPKIQKGAVRITRQRPG